MKILGIDTSSSVLSIGITGDDQVIGELVQNKALTHSERLMPHIAYLMETVDEKIEDIDYFAVTIGPGSFTGIRIGVATANAFAMAQGKRVIALSTLEALAHNFRQENLIIISTMYAQRDDYYRGIYEFNRDKQGKHQLMILKSEAAIARGEILEEATAYAKDKPVLLVGEIAGAIEEEVNGINKNKSISGNATDGIIKIADYDNNYIRPSTLCRFAEERAHLSRKYAKPVYIRKPQAEVQYEERQRLTEV